MYDQRFQTAQYYARLSLQTTSVTKISSLLTSLGSFPVSRNHAASTMIIIRSTIPKITRSKQVCNKYNMSGDHPQTIIQFQENKVENNMMCTKWVKSRITNLKAPKKNYCLHPQKNGRVQTMKADVKLGLTRSYISSLHIK